jgi:hypothetical protein
MSTAGEEHHRSDHTATHIVMGLVAGALVLAAAYLWLSDGSGPGGFTLKLPTLKFPTLQVPTLKLPTLAPAAAKVAIPAVRPVVMAQPTPAPIRSIRRAKPPVSDAAEGAPAPVDRTVSIDAQVAADAAAVGMTTRVRPSPGQ